MNTQLYLTNAMQMPMPIQIDPSPPQKKKKQKIYMAVKKKLLVLILFTGIHCYIKGSYNFSLTVKLEIN